MRNYHPRFLRFLGIITLISLFTVNGFSNPVSPLELVGTNSMVTVEVANIALFVNGFKDFSQKGFGQFGPIFVDRMSKSLRENFGADLSSSTGLYILGIAPNGTATINVYNQPKYNNDSQAKKRNVIVPVIILPIQNRRSFSNFMYMLFQKSKKGGKYETVGQSFGEGYVQAGNAFAYKFIGNFVVISENKQGFEYALSAYQSGRNLAKDSQTIKMAEEFKNYSMRFYLSIAEMGPLLDELSGSYSNKRQRRSRIMPFQNYKAGLDLYKNLVYAIDFNKKGIRVVQLSELSQRAIDMGLLKIYEDISTLDSTNPNFFLSKNPLMFVQAGLQGEYLYTFMYEYFFGKDGILGVSKEKANKKFAEFKAETGIDLENDLFKNVASPMQLFIGSVEPPLSLEKFTQGQSFASVGLKDEDRMVGALDKLAKIVAKKNQDELKMDKSRTPEVTFQRDASGKKEWFLTVVDRPRKKRHSDTTSVKTERIEIKIVVQNKMAYLAFKTMDIIAFTAESKQGKASINDYLLGMNEADRNDYGKVIAHYFLDITRVTGMIGEEDAKKNYIMGQVKAVLSNYLNVKGVARSEGAWMRSWFEINLK